MITEAGPQQSKSRSLTPHLRPAVSRLWDTLSRGRQSKRPPRSGRPVRLLDAPVSIADSIHRWLQDPPTADYHAQSSYHSVVAEQVRELSMALHRTGQGLTGVVDLMLATTPEAGVADDRTVTIDLHVIPAGTRTAADIVATIDHLAATGSSPALAAPSGAGSLTAWIADEIDSQSNGHPPTAYATDCPLSPPPCALLRTSATHGLAQATIHAYRHTGFTTRQAAVVRASQVAAMLTEHSGATLEELLSRLSMSRMELLAELGNLIELRAVFGIDHHWYPYDITVLAHRATRASHPGCTCATAFT